VPETGGRRTRHPAIHFQAAATFRHRAAFLSEGCQEQGTNSLNPIIGFSLNVICLSLAFALIGSVVWPIICRLLRIKPWSAATDGLLIVLAAVIFVMMRDYGHIFSDCRRKARSGSKW